MAVVTLEAHVFSVVLLLHVRGSVLAPNLLPDCLPTALFLVWD